MPLYRDDQGALYHSWRTDLRGEPAPTGAIQMPEDAWLRVARVKPEWAARLPRAALGLIVLSLPALAALGPLYLWGGVPGTLAALLIAWLLLGLGGIGLLAVACQQVPMDRPLSLVTPQPGGLFALELLRPWATVAMMTGALLMLDRVPELAGWQRWVSSVIGFIIALAAGANLRLIGRLRRGTA